MTEGKPYTERILLLAEKWKNGSISPEEKQEFIDWYNNYDDRELRYPGPEGIGQELHESVLQRIYAERPARRFTIVRWAAAAAILLALSTLGVFYYNSTTNKITATAKGTPQPGSEKAILTLSNGQQILLSPETTQISDSGVTIGNQQGLLTYQEAEQSVWNTVSTPHGGTYKVVLPDGTHVWLNAASSITFPTAFLGNERNVSVTGEAYFEVVKDVAKPFKVVIPGAGQTIDVLGTHFNVTSYIDEPFTATLLQGSVKIDSKFLHPGQAYTGGRVQEADTTQAVAWKNGYFQFNQTDIKAVMRQLERWYTISVVYDGVIPDKTFVGDLPRTAPLEQVLRILSKTGLHFTMEGTTMTVRK